MLLQKGQTLIMFGDSVTDCGRVKPDGEGTVASNPWGNGYVNLIGGYLGSVYPDYNIRVINKGTSGHQTSHLLERLEDDVLSYNPNWVSILIGINDIWRQFDLPYMLNHHVYLNDYEKNLITMIEKMKEKNINIVIMSPFMVDSNNKDAMRAMVDEYRAVCKKLAEKYHLIYIDLQDKFNDLMTKTHQMMIAYDRIHPTIIGHTLIQHAFLDAIQA